MTWAVVTLRPGHEVVLRVMTVIFSLAPTFSVGRLHCTTFAMEEKIRTAQVDACEENASSCIPMTGMCVTTMSRPVSSCLFVTVIS